jgi:hypothetical protein
LLVQFESAKAPVFAPVLWSITHGHETNRV